MPKFTKLHSKGKSSNMQKSCKVDPDKSDDTGPEESVKQFQLELCWCIQQLERSLEEKKGNEKQLQEAWKVLMILKNNNQPMVRKRQLMRTHFGDYRAKMAAEEKKLAKMASKIKISETPTQPKATFLRKSSFLTTGDNSFRFNFDVRNEESTKCAINSAEDPSDNEQKCSEIEEVQNILGNSSIDEPVNERVDNNIEGTTAAKNFKFKFTDAEFKFNFKFENSS